MNSSQIPARIMLTACIAAAILYKFRPRSSSIRKGQVALITGSSSGLGLALAHRFAHAGVRLALAARTQTDLEQARAELLSAGSVKNEADILLIAADLSSRTQAESAVKAATHYFGSIDILINNAGIIEVGPAENQLVETYEKAMAIDFFAAVYNTYAAMPSMLQRGSGSIVNIASIGGKFAVPHLLPYVAAKFALTGFSEGLHAELQSKGIRVTTVCPGLMRTGGESHAHFCGQVEKEKAWFQWFARTPLISASVTHAANRIFDAVDAGKTETIISPQAWLAARFNGVAPETTQAISALVNRFLLPAPSPD